ncbi:hypothetical protein Dsin_010686 [Dipteronia sinensis]|uniref:Uncharacterized protein n=1 Tax=Dipteronia sinensis TaxID=43782 RepID=A0AAE0ASZ0_9ROSI|nr:hypothetical protein Dsin_010686 [Dipteronia sinensis]
MSKEDKLFNFMSGLQTWAHAELRRQGVKDVPSAMDADEGLVVFRMSNSTPNSEKKKPTDGKKGKSKDMKEGMKERRRKVKYTREMTNIRTKGNPQTQGCLICSGPHFARECPEKEKVSSLISQDSECCVDASPSRVNHLQLLNTISVEKQTYKELMYVIAEVNRQEIRAMLDIGATNNFMTQRKVDRLGLKYGCQNYPRIRISVRI